MGKTVILLSPRPVKQVHCVQYFNNEIMQEEFCLMRFKLKSHVYNLISYAAPTIGLSNFHVTILNSTTVEAVWRLPYATTGINGIVRGFKIYVVKVNGTRQIINVEDPTAQTYIITGLEQSATYLFSIVIYTVGDGPQSVILHKTMPDSGDYT